VQWGYAGRLIRRGPPGPLQVCWLGSPQGWRPIWACTAPPLAPARAPRFRQKETTAPVGGHWVHPCHQPGRDQCPDHRRTLAGLLQSGHQGCRRAAGRIRSDGTAGHSSIPGWGGGAVLPLGAAGVQHGSAAGPLGAGWPGSAKPLRSMPLRLALARADARLAVLALRWVPFTGQFWTLTSLTLGGRNRVRPQCRPHGEFCLPVRCGALHGSTSTGSGPV